LRTLSTSTHLRHSLISTISSRVRIRISKPSMVPVSTSGLPLEVATPAPSQPGSSLSTLVPPQPGLLLELSILFRTTAPMIMISTRPPPAAGKLALTLSETSQTILSRPFQGSLDLMRSFTSTLSSVEETSKLLM
jgi:hypothetical protein